jgi:hypothetical protein
MSNKKIKEVSAKINLIDWLTYTIITGFILIPFFPKEINKHIGVSLIIGFLFGMLNRIIRELVLLREQLNKEE